MKQQVRRWAQAVAAVFVVVLAFNAPLAMMITGAGQSLGGSRSEGLLALFWGLLSTAVGIETAGCLVVLALTVLISRRLLHGRHSLLLGALLLGAVSWAYLWFVNDQATAGALSMVYGWTEILKDTALPLVAGAWILRDRSARTGADLVTPEVPGSWDAVGGTLQFEPDGIFTLTRPGADTTAGLWEPGAGARPQVVLRVDAPTDLGHGWQATVLDLEVGPHGAVLRPAGAAAGAGVGEYRRREAEAALEVSVGYVGTLELLES